MSIVSNALRASLDVLFPVRCIGCGRSGAYICVLCLGKARRTQPGPPGGEGPLANVMTPFVYEGVVRTAVLHLKYRGVRTLVPEMARPMAWELGML